MRLRFYPTPQLAEYHGWHHGQRLSFRPGEEKEVPDEKAHALLADFPGNFVSVAQPQPPQASTFEDPPVDRMIRKARKK